MKSIRAFLKAIRIEEWIVFISSATVIMISAVVYHENFSIARIAFQMLKYFSFGDPFLLLLFPMIYLLFLWKFYWLLANFIVDVILGKSRLPKGSGSELLYSILEPLRIGLPSVFIAIVFYGLLGHLSYNLRFSGKDIALLAADRILTRVIPFLYLPTIVTSPFWAWMFKYAYYSLGIVMGVMMGVFFFRKKTQIIFRQTLIAFTISLIVSFTIFANVPCQDPNNYFIRNLRGNIFPPDITEALDRYHPSSQVQQSIQAIGNAETAQTADKSVPISCFPSMHAVWAFLVIYFLAVTWRKSLFLSIPWVILLLVGGIYYAQHYVIDYVVGIPVAAICIFLSHEALQLEKAWRKETPAGASR